MRLLPSAQCGARFAAKQSVDLADVEAELGERGLQRHAFVAIERHLIARPAGDDGRCAFQLIGQQANRQRIACRVVVFQDRFEIRKDEERRSARARGKIDGCRFVRDGKLAARNRLHAALRPGRYRHRVVEIGVFVSEVFRQRDFEAPGLAEFPSRGGDHIGR